MTAPHFEKLLPAGNLTSRIAGLTVPVADVLAGYWLASPTLKFGPDLVILIITILVLQGVTNWVRAPASRSRFPLLIAGWPPVRMLLGMSLSYPWQPTFLILCPIALAIYVAAGQSLRSDESILRGRVVAAAMGTIAALLLLGFVSALRMAHDTFAMVLWLALFIHLVRVLRRAIRDPSVMRMDYAAATLAAGQIAFDATIATTTQGWQAGVVVLALLFPIVISGIHRNRRSRYSRCSEAGIVP